MEKIAHAEPENILLLCDVPPCNNYSGGIHLNQLVESLLNAGHRVYCFCAISPELSPAVSEMMNKAVDFCVAIKPDECSVGTGGQKKYEQSIRRITQKCVRYARKNNITKIWCPLQGEVLAKVLDELSKAMAIPYVVQIWDPVEWWAHVCKFDEARTTKLLAKYDELVDGAYRCMTASPNMTSWYEKRFGDKKFVEVTTMLRDDCMPKSKTAGQKFVIAIAGQAYASNGIESLLDALEAMNWRYDGKSIYFQHYGNGGGGINFDKYNPERVQLMGNYAQADLAKQLAKVNLLYCPYFFSMDAVFKKVAELSFPSKLITYLSIGQVPILSHAPNYSSVDTFCAKNKCAFRIDSDDAQKVERTLKSILANYEDEKADIVKNILAARQKFLPENVIKNFFWALDVGNARVFSENEIAVNFHSFTEEFKKLMLRRKIARLPRGATRYGVRVVRFVSSGTVRWMNRGVGDVNFRAKVGQKKYVLELNNIDLHGSRFNGFDIQKFVNAKSRKIFVQQIVNHKETNDKNVIELFKNRYMTEFTHAMSGAEAEIMRTKGMLSITGAALENSVYYKRADILHFHMYHNMLMPNHFLEYVPAGKQIILDLHDTYFLTDDCKCQSCKKRRGSSEPIKMLEVFRFANDNCHPLNNQREQILNSIDATFIVHSSFMLDLFKRSPITKDIKNVRLVPFGIDSDKFVNRGDNAKLREKYKIPKDNIVLFCRAQKVFKGIEYIEQALALMDEKQQISVVTVSEIGHLNSLKDKYQIIDLGVTGEEDKLIELYNLCDVFLAPSTEESFGFMAVEAMSCEKPVIVFDGTALPSTTFAPKCGYVVPKGDVEGLKKAIEFMITNKGERERRGKLGRKLVLEHYKVEDYYQRNLELYESLSDKKSRRVTKPNGEIVLNAEAKSLLCSLKKVHAGLLPRYKFSNIFPEASKCTSANINRKIDYSSDNIQNVLREYNSAIYDILKKNKYSAAKTVEAVMPDLVMRKLRKGGRHEDEL